MKRRTTIINLQKIFFLEKEKLCVQEDNLKASIFKYESGIHAVRLQNSKGFIIILPFKGQQIWDAVFNGKSMKMGTILTEPKDVGFFLDSYSCLMMHCGALRMGCPSFEDTHPLHGELPYVDYDRAEIILGEDDKGKYIGVSGVYEHRPAFASDYAAKPIVKLYENTNMIDISITIENLLHQPMELMYMCHINFSMGQSSIIQSLGWSEKDMVLSTAHLHEQDKLSADKKKLLEQLRQTPELTKKLTKEAVYDPEINYFLKNPSVDKKGWAYFLKIMDDGTGSYIVYKPEILTHAVRWIWKNEDYDILGLVLPATCEPEGYIHEKAKGNVKTLQGKESIKFNVKTGWLDKTETEKMKEYIECGFGAGKEPYWNNIS